MSAKADIWMPLYIGDYLRDTTRLTTAQHGAYLLLIMDYWTNGAPPDDDAVLASITKSTTEEWPKLKAAIMSKFDLVDGCWQHGRIEQELCEAKDNKQKRKERSEKANEAKAAKQALMVTSEVTYKVADKDTVEATPSPSPSPSPTYSSELPSSTKKVLSAKKPVDVSDVVWLSYLTLRKAKRAPVTELVVLANRREAVKAGIDLEQALTICCEIGWQAFNAGYWENRQSKPTSFNNPADAARTTVPGSKERDPALVKIEKDRQNAAPPPAEVKAKMAELLGRMKA